jgi:ABC-2 type transport system permease protein
MSDTTLAIAIPDRARLSSAYTALLRWQLGRIGPLLPLVVIVQVLMSAGLVIGFGFLIPDIDDATALFLSTGIPTILLLTVGLVLVPSVVAQSKSEGTFGYQRTLPAPRPFVFLADLTVWTVVALPGIVVALVIAWLRYDLALAINWPLLLAAALLVTITSAAVGYMIAVVLPPMVTQLVTQALVFFIILFSPISFPTTQLPAWFQTVHDILPIRPAADLLRAGLASTTYSVEMRDVIVLLVWCAVGIAVSMNALIRRT